MSAQSMESLAKANEIRLEMAALKRDIRKLPRREALERCADLLERPPHSIYRMRVGTLLSSVHRYGPGRVDHLLRRGEVRGMVADWSIGRLSVRQREHIARLVREAARR